MVACEPPSLASASAWWRVTFSEERLEERDDEQRSAEQEGDDAADERDAPQDSEQLKPARRIRKAGDGAETTKERDDGSAEPDDQSLAKCGTQLHGALAVR